jgi:glycine C-acetyltransferase
LEDNASTRRLVKKNSVTELQKEKLPFYRTNIHYTDIFFMSPHYRAHIKSQLDAIRVAGTYKNERVLSTPQGTLVRTNGGTAVLNLCANNYLGLAQHPKVRQAAHEALEHWGYGLASVRFICGTQGVHKELEDALSRFLGTEDTILYGSCFDANGGLFETILGAEDAVISDELNHASIIDGLRLCKARRYRYKNCDVADLEAQLKAADANGARFKLIATDGVFSMDGHIAPLSEICDLAEKYNASVMVDDSHAVGFMGKNGRGTHEHCGVLERVDILTGTLGKALGGASGGYTSGRREIIELLRQRSRPYLFSNTLSPSIAGASLEALRLLTTSTNLRDKLEANTRWFRKAMTDAGFDILPGIHPIVPIMLGNAAFASNFADAMLDRGVYVIGFSYPVVPEGKARIRTQISAAHTQADLEMAVAAFIDTRDQLNV